MCISELRVFYSVFFLILRIYIIIIYTISHNTYSDFFKIRGSVTTALWHHCSVAHVFNKTE